MSKKTCFRIKQAMKILFSLGIVFFLTTSAWASISYTPSSPKVGETVTFTVTPPSGDIVGSVQWNFGDGSTETLSPPSAEHTYSSLGTYSVRATYRYQVQPGAPTIEQTDTTSITVAPAPTPSISYSPSHPTAGQVVTFTAHNFSSTTCIKWNFGDGTIVNDTSLPSITHLYIHPGTYTVKAYDNCGAEVTATTTVSIGGAERDISYTPADPRVHEEVTFTANNFFSTQIKWDFGDGTVIPQGTTTARHTYKSAGTYTVKAWDYYGQGQVQATQQTLSSVTTQITIGPDPRTISYSPTPALTNQEITFTASNFRSSCIRWDFGDGTIVAQGSAVETHIYENGGTYTISAYDHCGADKFPKSIALKVFPRRGPAAPFSISSVRLRFEDDKAYKQVPKGFTPLLAFADIKCEGTGILQAQWLVDGRLLPILSQSLHFAKPKTISSGKATPLPTHAPGMHEVSLHIIQPRVDFEIPIIRYFVSVEEIKPQLRILLSKVNDLGGTIMTIEEDHILLPPGRNYIFSGTVENLSKEEISSAFLQVSLVGEVVDQQMIRKLRPGEKRQFRTSILSDVTPERQLTLRVLDTSAKGQVLGVRDLRLFSTLPPEVIREIEQRERAVPLAGPGPVIISLNPSVVGVGSGPIVPLSINGTGFAPATIVRVRQAGVPGSGEDYTPEYIDSTLLEVTIPEIWTSVSQRLEVRVKRQYPDTTWIASDWVPLRVGFLGPAERAEALGGRELRVLRLLFPNGDRNLHIGQEYLIHWKNTVGGDVRVELWKGRERAKILAWRVPPWGDDGYDGILWTVPGTIEPHFAYRVLIKSWDAPYSDWSDNRFSILSSLVDFPIHTYSEIARTWGADGEGNYPRQAWVGDDDNIGVRAILGFYIGAIPSEAVIERANLYLPRTEGFTGNPFDLGDFQVIVIPEPSGDVSDYHYLGCLVYEGRVPFWFDEVDAKSSLNAARRDGRQWYYVRLQFADETDNDDEDDQLGFKVHGDDRCTLQVVYYYPYRPE